MKSLCVLIDAFIEKGAACGSQGHAVVFMDMQRSALLEKIKESFYLLINIMTLSYFCDDCFFLRYTFGSLYP